MRWKHVVGNFIKKNAKNTDSEGWEVKLGTAWGKFWAIELTVRAERGRSSQPSSERRKTKNWKRRRKIPHQRKKAGVLALARVKGKKRGRWGGGGQARLPKKMGYDFSEKYLHDAAAPTLAGGDQRFLTQGRAGGFWLGGRRGKESVVPKIGERLSNDKPTKVTYANKGKREWTRVTKSKSLFETRIFRESHCPGS